MTAPEYETVMILQGAEVFNRWSDSDKKYNASFATNGQSYVDSTGEDTVVIAGITSPVWEHLPEEDRQRAQPFVAPYRQHASGPEEYGHSSCRISSYDDYSIDAPTNEKEPFYVIGFSTPLDVNQLLGKLARSTQLKSARFYCGPAFGVSTSVTPIEDGIEDIDGDDDSMSYTDFTRWFASNGDEPFEVMRIDFEGSSVTWEPAVELSKFWPGVAKAMLAAYGNGNPTIMIGSTNFNPADVVKLIEDFATPAVVERTSEIIAFIEERMEPRDVPTFPTQERPPAKQIDLEF